MKRLPVGLRGEEEKLSLDKQGRGAESEAAVSNPRRERRGGAGTRGFPLLFFGCFCFCGEVFVMH